MKRDAVQVQRDNDDLPSLFARLADQTTELLDAKLALLKIELKEDATAYVRGMVMILVGAVVALIGFALLNVAIAFLISTLFNGTTLSQPTRYGLGFIITAAVYLIIGVVLIVINKNKLAEQNLVPERSVAELERDKTVLEREL